MKSFSNLLTRTHKNGLTYIPLGFQQVLKGERMAVYKLNGDVAYVDGPCRPLVYRSSVKILDRYVVSPNQGITIQFKDGDEKYIKGPTSVWEDPINHFDHQIHENIDIDSNKVLVVYRRKKDEEVEREIIKGPASYVPKKDEWIHNFVWHGRDFDKPHINRKKAGALQFQQLMLTPDQLYFDVESVKTKDDVEMTLKMVIFFQLEDVEKMLDATHDPIAELINSISADTIDFVSNHTFEEFKIKQQSLNILDSFDQLTKRSQRIGYDISKVVYRGYRASRTIEDMHENAAETRTRMVLKKEKLEKEQELVDYELAKNTERSKEKLDLERKEELHKLEIIDMNDKATHNRIKVEHEEEYRHKQKMSELDLTKLGEEQEVKMKLIDKLKSSGVDLTKYYESMHYGRPDKWTKIDSNVTPIVEIKDRD